MRVMVKKCLGTLVVITLAVSAQALLVDLGPGSFSPLASTITFSEVPYGSVDPVYNFLAVPGLGNVTVSFGGHFLGQTTTGGFPDTLSDTTPTGPLALDPSAPVTFVNNDGANPTSPVLSGTPLFNGPISILFSVPVAGVALDGGYFNTVGATTIEAYDVNGNSLGSIVNSMLGIETYGLADGGGANVIAGISFYITGSEPAGFAIDNVTFGASEVIEDPDVTVPDGGATFLLLVLGCAAGLGLRRRS